VSAPKRWIEPEPEEAARLRLVFGALAPSLADQLQRYRLPGGEPNGWQTSADAITRLVVQGLATDAEARRMRQKLTKKIADTLTRGARVRAIRAAS
jgi:hypothetical protein